MRRTCQMRQLTQAIAWARVAARSKLSHCHQEDAGNIVFDPLQTSSRRKRLITIRFNYVQRDGPRNTLVSWVVQPGLRK